MRLAELADHLRPYADDLLPHDEGGPDECLVRAGELLATADSAAEVADRLGSRVDRMRAEPAGDVVRLILRPQLREHPVDLAADLAGGPTVQPNHVHLGCAELTGTPIEFGTGAHPRPADLPPSPATELWQPPVTVALLDTGLDPHPWFAGRPWLSDWGLSPEVLHPGLPAEADRQAGHGTFVAGVLLRHAPGVTVRHHRTLSSLGITDDATVAAGIDRVRTMAAIRRERLDLMVLTAGCYTAHDQCPPVLRRAIERLGETMLVASAGNNATSRPFWPAALPEVVGVAATSADGRLADFSNFGDWVNASAPGVEVRSSFVRLARDEHGIAPDTATRVYGGASWSGTSFAAPRIAAHLAHLLRVGMPPKAARGQVCRSMVG
ncbi:MAG TPA: S8/S53 family peptidase [Pseudonocardiaceae bacterium]|jgi:hypothetical protein|nr:S8/S53 family peptidase [Pseudonocardiaceae bacterium]